MNQFFTPELDEILIPLNGRYQSYPLLFLTGADTFAPGRSMAGLGQAPYRYITTRGPEQDGSTPVALRWDERTMQLRLEYRQIDRQLYWWIRQKILSLISPTRCFGNSSITPMIYRKWYPSGRLIRGSDAEVTNGSAVVIVPYGRFIDRGGLIAGAGIILAGVSYTIASVPNDYTLELTSNYAGATGTVSWSYTSNQTRRDLFCLPEAGPSLDVSSDSEQFYPFGFSDVVRFIAHNPFWFGEEQSETWILPDSFGDLVFDGAGAFFGAGLSGRWLFAPNAINEFVEVVYWGSYRARPVLVVTGPAESIAFENETTGLSILVEVSIVAGESVTIDTQNTTVTKSDGTNLLPVTSGDISFFSIEPENNEHTRINRIFVGFSGATAESSAVMTWRNAYTGI